MESANITPKEMIPIVFAAAVWGKHWSGSTVQCACDNDVVVAVINSGSSKEKHLMQLMQCLFFFAAHFQFAIIASNNPGSKNVQADALSRNNH